MLREVVISVFGLFHPTELDIAPADHRLLEVTCGSTRKQLEGKARKLSLKVGCHVSGTFTLSVPGRIERTFTGHLRVEPGLTALLTLDLESAVAATVAAELPSTTPAAALEAQAIAVRSYFASLPAGRHAYRAFCDTTHCQHIRGAIASDHPAARATKATQGLVLQYQSKILTAMYSAACTGSRQAGVANADGYVYAAVPCNYCQRHPGNTKRLAHRKGLCQAGAADLARTGKTAEEILRHYYPGTRVTSL
ncbi:hypothetical protein F183_A45360 [Bryobacterales bacterium F-183]|nr:hypothetical protein F183_A45360 [Bryobacterales bacterium F-183]